MADLTWKEESAGHWSRVMDDTDNHFFVMGKAAHKYQREFGWLSVTIKIDFGRLDIESTTSRAWKNLRYVHPLLASYLADGRRHYLIADEQELDAWMHETYFVNNTATSADELRLSLRFSHRAQLHVLPRTSEVLLCVGHDILDGQGILSWVNRFLDELDSPSPGVGFGDEHKNLPPPFVLAANVGKAEESHQAKIGQDLQAWLGALPWLSIPTQNADKDPGDTRSKRQVLTKEETSFVIEAAKARGFTPTYVVEASAILAAVALDPDSAGKSYGSCGMFSLRSLVEPKWKQSAVPYLAIHPMAIKPGTFDETARQLKTYYVTQKADPEAFKSIAGLMLQTFTKMTSEAPTPPPGQNSMFTISSIGKCEPTLRSEHGEIKMTGFDIVVETPNATVTSFMLTLDGVLSWTSVYNEVYHTEEAISSWSNKTKEILLEGLRD